MLQYMITRCALLLRSYPTSVDEDQTILKEEQVEYFSSPYTRSENNIEGSHREE